MNILVIGGTGMLREAVLEIASDGNNSITLLSRNSYEVHWPDNVKTLYMDWLDDASILDVYSILSKKIKFDMMISWIHNNGLKCLPILEDCIKAKSKTIRILGSSYGDPRLLLKNDSHIRDDLERQYVILGCVKNNKNFQRWLTNTEISNGVLEAYKNNKSVHLIGELLSQN